MVKRYLQICFRRMRIVFLTRGVEIVTAKSELGSKWNGKGYFRHIIADSPEIHASLPVIATQPQQDKFLNQKSNTKSCADGE
jgi:hypothetical protein